MQEGGAPPPSCASAQGPERWKICLKADNIQNEIFPLISILPWYIGNLKKKGFKRPNIFEEIYKIDNSILGNSKKLADWLWINIIFFIKGLLRPSILSLYKKNGLPEGRQIFTSNFEIFYLLGWRWNKFLLFYFQFYFSKHNKV